MGASAPVALAECAASPVHACMVSYYIINYKIMNAAAGRKFFNFTMPRLLLNHIAVCNATFSHTNGNPHCAQRLPIALPPLPLIQPTVAKQNAPQKNIILCLVLPQIKHLFLAPLVLGMGGVGKQPDMSKPGPSLWICKAPVLGFRP